LRQKKQRSQQKKVAILRLDKELKKVKENRLTKKQQNAINLLIYSNKSQKQIAKAVEAMSETIKSMQM